MPLSGTSSKQVSINLPNMYQENYENEFDDDEYYNIQLNIEGIRLIHEGLRQAVSKWSGGAPEEQENLMAMRDNFYRMILEHSFQNMSLD